MSQALSEIGIASSMRFLISLLIQGVNRICLIPQFRAMLFKALGAKVGHNAIIHPVRLMNLYRGSMSNLTMGHQCFIGEECLLDLADRIILEDHVTLAERVVIMTHANVGYKDHPLQAQFPKHQAPVKLERGCFVGVNSTVLAGVTIGAKSYIAAGAVVTSDIPPGKVAGGVPAKVIRDVEDNHA